MNSARNFPNPLLAFILLWSTMLFAQPTPNAYNQWAFGANVGFNVMTNTALANTSIVTQEGCASYCDNAGNLLFYTDGRRLWRMPGNMLAVGGPMNGTPNNTGGSATQGVVILPQINMPNRFWIFIVSDAQGVWPTFFPMNNGLSVWDYDLINNQVTQTFPLNINSFCTEGITAIPDCNGIDFWVIVKPIINPTNTSPSNPPFNPVDAPNATNNCLYAYHVTAAGVDPNPVVSTFNSPAAYEPTLNTVPYNWVMGMKASPDTRFFALGERQAVLPATAGRINLYRFDCGSGTFDFIRSQAQPNLAYGISFSPNSNILYASNGATNIRQYDITNLDSELLCHGGIDTLLFVDIPVQNPSAIYQLQLTTPPNNRILIAQNGATTLDVLNTPDLWMTPGYANNALILNAFSTSRSSLPNNMDAQLITNPDPLQVTACPCGNCFELTGCANVVTWDFGDGTPVLTGSGYTPITANGTYGTFLSPCHDFPAPGTYTVTVTSGVQQTQVVVNVSAGWNQSTLNSSPGGDKGNDIITDQNGNVYVAGTLNLSTQFPGGICPNITINSNSFGTTSAYIAKYNSCGDLLWVNFEDAPQANSTGTGLAYDQQRNVVFLSGYGIGPAGLRSQTTASAPCVNPVPGLGLPAQGIYVAKFDATTGGFIDAYTTGFPNQLSVKPNVMIDAKHIGNPFSNSTDIYITGTYNASSPAGDIIFVRDVNNTGGTYTVSWNNYSIGPKAAYNTSWDISYSTTYNRVYITGLFAGSINFPSSTALLTTSLSEAFVWGFNAANGFTVGRNNLGITGLGSTAVGTSVFATINGVYATGYFNANLTSPYGLGTPFNGPAAFRSYMMLLDPATLIAASGQDIQSSTGNVQATGVSVSFQQIQAVITGRITGNITAPGFVPNNGNYTTATPPNPKMFLAAFNMNTLSPRWCNTATDAVLNSSHLSSRVVADLDFSYATGGYINQMDYNFFANPPFSGPLVSSPMGQMNSYIVRNDMNNSGSFRLMPEGQQEESNEIKYVTDLDSRVTVYPNPNNGQFNLRINEPENENDRELISVVVYDMLGNLVFERKGISENEIVIDISASSKGIYLVKCMIGERISTVKVSNQ